MAILYPLRCLLLSPISGKPLERVLRGYTLTSYLRPTLLPTHLIRPVVVNGRKTYHASSVLLFPNDTLMHSKMKEKLEEMEDFRDAREPVELFRKLIFILFVLWMVLLV